MGTAEQIFFLIIAAIIVGIIWFSYSNAKKSKRIDDNKRQERYEEEMRNYVDSKEWYEGKYAVFEEDENGYYRELLPEESYDEFRERIKNEYMQGESDEFEVLSTAGYLAERPEKPVEKEFKGYFVRTLAINTIWAVGVLIVAGVFVSVSAVALAIVAVFGLIALIGIGCSM